MDFISIVIPNFNKARYLEEALNSIKDQTHSNWEVIIVDDGSTDNSVEILERYCHAHSGFRLIHREEEPKGAPHCRNIGVEAAKGDFVIFMDSDDLITKTCLEHRLREFQAYPYCDFMVFPCGTFYSEIGDNAMVWKVPVDKHLERFLSHEIPWTMTGPMWKRSVLNLVGEFDTDFPRFQDLEFHTRALLVPGIRFVVSSITKPDLYYRIDQKRTDITPEDFYDNRVTGAELYVEKTTRLLKEYGMDSKVPLMRGILFRNVTMLLYERTVGSIDKAAYKSLLKRLFQLSENLGNRSWLRIYIRLYRLGFYRVKGFNFVSELVFFML